MKNQVLEEKTVILPGLVTSDECILASVSETPLRTGTAWTQPNSRDHKVLSKDYRVSDEKAATSIRLEYSNTDEKAETTITSMIETISAEDRYETVNRVAYKAFSRINDNHWVAVICGGTEADPEAPSLEIGPPVDLNEHQIFLSSRVNDVVKDQQLERIIRKRYTKLDERNYYIYFSTANATYHNLKTVYDKDELFRTLAVGDQYQDLLDSSTKVWIVKEKRVCFAESIGGIDFHFRVILLVSST